MTGRRLLSDWSPVRTAPHTPVPPTMRAWVLGGPEESSLVEKPTPAPVRAEVLVRVDAVAICATDLEVIRHGTPALIEGGPPFHKNFTPGHEYMGTVAALGPGVDEFEIGQRVTVEIHAGCGQCKRCRTGMYTSCHNYGLNWGDRDKGHRANGFTSDGGFAEYAVNNVDTLIRVPDAMSDEEATLVVTAGASTYGLTELGGLVRAAIEAGGPAREEAFAQATAARAVAATYPPIAAMKRVAAWRSADDAWLRMAPPLTPLSAAQEAALRADLDALRLARAA